jgi:predicted small lipoprotein YifL
MKSIAFLAAIACVASLTGCGDKSSKNAAPAAQASQGNEKDVATRFAEQKAAADNAFQASQASNERNQLIDNLSAMGKRWGDGLNEAAKTGRSDMPAMIKKLEGIKAEAEALPVNDCTGKARTTLVSAMAAAIESFNMFIKETGEASAATKQKMQQASDLLQSAEKEIEACKPIS